jgi:hypothetical protein
MEIKTWKTLYQFLKKRTFYPFHSPGFIFYFIFIIVLVGSFGLFYDILKDSYWGCDYEIDTNKLKSIVMSMTNIGLSLVAASTIDLLFVSKKKLAEEENDINNWINLKIEIAKNKSRLYNYDIEQYSKRIDQLKEFNLNKPNLANKTEREIRDIEKKLAKKTELIKKWNNKLQYLSDKLKQKEFEKNIGYQFSLIKGDVRIFGISCLIIQFVLWIIANQANENSIYLRIAFGTISLFLGYYIWWISNAKNKLLINDTNYIIDGREMGGVTNGPLAGTTEGYNE